VPEISGHDLVREWKSAMQSVLSVATSAGGRSSELTEQLVAPMQRQLEIVQNVLDREQRIQRQLLTRVFGPFDAVFDLLEQSAAAVGKTAEALNQSARAMEQAAELMKVQADLMGRTLQTLREPAELAKAAAGLDRRSRKGR
jgi:hypothetical protein